MKYFYDTRKDSYKFGDESVNFFVNVGLQVTRKCNLKCVYCSDSDNGMEPAADVTKKIIDKLVAYGMKRLCITGGEPLLRADLAEILKYAKNRGLTITLSTNGILLTKVILENIKPYIDNIRFSLRGSEEIHDKVTGVKGSYQKAVGAIRLAKSIGLPVSVVSTVVKDNFEQMEEVAKLCETLGVEKLYFFSLIPRGRAIDMFNKLNVTIDKLTREFNRVVEISRSQNWNLDIKVANFTIEGECVLVFPNGDMVAVPSFTDEGNHKILGNLLTEDLKTIWGRYPFKENYINYYRNH